MIGPRGAVVVAGLTLAVSACAQPAPQATTKPAYDPVTGTVRSARYRGVPLGGMGCGTIELLTDGTVSHATINNNWDQPTGDLRGCFAALWTSAGGKTQARVLKGSSEYGLPAASTVEYRSQFPQALLRYPDASLPVSVSLRAYSALIPHDIKNSNLPAVLFVLTITNEARAPVEVSAALSWENFLGIGGSASKGKFGSRNGNTVAVIPGSEGLFGLRMASSDRMDIDPAHRLVYNAQGTYALMTQPQIPEAQVTTAGWNSLDGKPGWWEEFAKQGSVSGTAPAGKEGSLHPAGVVAVKLALKEKETREIPFVFAWHTPRLYTAGGTEYGHLYEKSFADAVAVARYALENRLNLLATTEEWQNRLLRSSLPPWLSRKLINDASVLAANTILTNDSGLGGTAPGPPLFATMVSPGSKEESGVLGGLDRRHAGHGLLMRFFPGLDVQELRSFADAQAPSGMLPWLNGRLDEVIGKPPPAMTENPAATFRAACGFAIQVAEIRRWLGDQELVDRLYPAAKHAMEWAIPFAKQNAGLGATELFYKQQAEALYVASLLASRQLAEAMSDRQYRSVVEETLTSLLPSIKEIPTNLIAQAQWPSDLLETGGVLEGGGGLPPYTGLSSIYAPHGERPNMSAAVRAEAAHSAAVLAARGMVDEAVSALRYVDDAWIYGAEKSVNRDALVFHEASILGPSSWNALRALSGFNVDLMQGRLVIAPTLPKGAKSLTVPLFAPTFWAMLDYRTGLGGAKLAFRLDRMMPAIVGLDGEKRKPQASAAQAAPNAAPKEKKAPLSPSSFLLLKQVVLPPGAAGEPRVSASIGRAPVPGKVARDDRGRLVYTFDSPVQLNTGQALNFNIR